MPQYQRPTGTLDTLPEDQHYWYHVRARARHLAELAGFERVDVPIFEVTELFARGVGEGTDIVDKEMYSFADKGGHELTLRPEFTAGLVRAYIENGMYVLPQPVKLYAFGPVFRYERPQAGRYRQHTQFDVEILGEQDPAADLEVMLLAWDLYADLGFRDLAFQLNSTGHLCTECAEHFAALREYLDLLGRSYTINHRLVRGLDYYTKTVFEVWAAGIGAQSAVCGGGRYDGLAELLGGQPMPGVGFASGLERIILVMKQLGVEVPPLPTPPVFLAHLGPQARREALRLVDVLRRAGVGAWLSFGERGLRSQLREAGKRGVRYTIILGEDELAAGVATVRDMQAGEQVSVELAELVEWLRTRI